MESIKHKMDTMVKEKDAAIEKAMGFEAETGDLVKAAAKFEKEVDEIQRKIAKDLIQNRLFFVIKLDVFGWITSMLVKDVGDEMFC